MSARLARLLLCALLVAPQAALAACPEGMRPLSGGHFTLADGSATVDVAPYCLDQIEVTAAGFAACVRDGTCPDEGLQCGRAATYAARGKATHPVNCVSWFQADAFCRASGKRLPFDPAAAAAPAGPAVATPLQVEIGTIRIDLQAGAGGR